MQTATEIKPVGLDRSDPTTELRRCYIDVLDGLTLDLLGKTFGAGKTSADHLKWMAGEILSNIRTMPVDKIGRWVGFIQGVMASNGVLDVDAERDRTRPIFARAQVPGAWVCWICKEEHTGEPEFLVQSMAGPFRYCAKCSPVRSR